MALLDAVATLAAARGIAIAAIHVHHGLSLHADAWAQHCADLCALRGIPYLRRDVTVERGPRISIEAAARRARHKALAAGAADMHADALLLAHHRDDQAETLLLQLLRGAGPHGLAAMPVARTDANGLIWLRPLLDVPRSAIDAYVQRRGLRFVDDDSNTDTRYARNAMRVHLAPALATIAPAYGVTLARAAELQADAAQLADDLAAADAAGAWDGATLDQSALIALPGYRARNLLRWFLRMQGLPAPSRARLAAMLGQLVRARPGARVRLAHAHAEIGIHRGHVVVHAPAPPPFAHLWHGETALDLPHGTLRFVAAHDGGLNPDRLRSAPVMIRARAGGERLDLGSGRPRRALKLLLQEAGLPAWERAALPLVFCGDALAAVPGIGVDVAFRAAPGRAGLALAWVPNAFRGALTAEAQVAGSTAIG